MPLARHKALVSDYRYTGGQSFKRSLRGKENLMKLQTRIKAGRPNPNHNTIVR